MVGGWLLTRLAGTKVQKIILSKKRKGPIVLKSIFGVGEDAKFLKINL